MERWGRLAPVRHTKTGRTVRRARALHALCKKSTVFHHRSPWVPGS